MKWGEEEEGGQNIPQGPPWHRLTCPLGTDESMGDWWGQWMRRGDCEIGTPSASGCLWDARAETPPTPGLGDLGE